MNVQKDIDESTCLVSKKREGLSVFFTTLCIVDLFGVFPVIALPKAIIDCGTYGIPIVLFVFSLQIYSAILLGRCWMMAVEINPSMRDKNRYPYAAVAEMTHGSRLKNLVTVLLDATVFGGGIPNLLVASQNLQLFGSRITHDEFNFSFCWWLMIIGLLLCPVMWLGSPKDMKSIAFMSVAFVSTVTVLTCYCILSDATSTPASVASDATPSVNEMLVAYGIIAFQFDIHPMLMTIQVDMKDNSKIGTAVIGGFLVTGAMFAITTVLATYRYGDAVTPNILQGLPESYPMYAIVLLVTLQLGLSSAVGSSALFQHIEDTFKISRDFSVKRCLVRSLVVASAVLLGEIVPRFDLVMGLIGSTLTGPLMFILPPLLYAKLLKMKSEDRSGRFKSVCSSSARAQIVLSRIIIVFGIAITAMSTFYNWANVIHYARFTPSCIANVTSTLHFLNM